MARTHTATSKVSVMRSQPQRRGVLMRVERVGVGVVMLQLLFIC
ncbi:MULTISPECIES: hypothetical protein [Acidovorax]|uniref:Uncharacterized protein n=1 Tax=Acidovorax soli TaxID=592050 RepID=A0A1H4EEF6_9BURK|nr:MULTISPECIES: hypothetical protein [Acidovorax]SEA83413.1 hypothetical protein SAMN05421875_13435 [Acidovorax soli]